MTKSELLKYINDNFNKNDDLLIEDKGEEVIITINDFEGFNEDGSEIERELSFDDDDLLEFLQKECFIYEENLYITFIFKGFIIKVGYASYSI